jgi:uncharacterized protein (DUF169 family)
MDKITRQFEREFGGVWTKVKFYKKMPDNSDYKIVEGVRFCEAVVKARLSPVILKGSDISCVGAKYAFGWDRQVGEEIVNACCKKRHISFDIAKSILLATPQLDIPPAAIGLNTDGRPDLLISYPQPEQFMNLLKVFQQYKGKNLTVSLSSIMGVCGNVVVRAYLEGKISLSFGCDDSREYGRISRDRLAVGIPYSQVAIFVPALISKV